MIGSVLLTAGKWMTRRDNKKLDATLAPPTGLFNTNLTASYLQIDLHPFITSLSMDQ